jgi:hypothetical protein
MQCVAGLDRLSKADLRVVCDPDAGSWVIFKWMFSAVVRARCFVYWMF